MSSHSDQGICSVLVKLLTDIFGMSLHQGCMRVDVQLSESRVSRSSVSCRIESEHLPNAVVSQVEVFSTSEKSLVCDDCYLDPHDVTAMYAVSKLWCEVAVSLVNGIADDLFGSQSASSFSFAAHEPPGFECDELDHFRKCSF